MDARLISISRRADGLSPDAVFASARGRERYLWREGDSALVGVGIAAELTAWGERRFAAIEEKARALFEGVQVIGEGVKEALPRLFGGFSFQAEFITEQTWAKFAPAYFILPHFQLVVRGGAAWLTLNVQLAPDEAIDPDGLCAALDAAYDAMCAYQYAPAAPARPLDLRYPMTPDAWEGMIGAAVADMQAGAMRKVVLSRVCELRFAHDVDVDAALAYLHTAYPDCTRFAFEPIPSLVFFGATPELLVAVRGKQVETEALAGSIRRGTDADDDVALAAALLADPKERGEHQLVVEGIRERLTPLTTALDCDDAPGVRRLKNIQHLHTPIAGTLRENTGVLPLVELLHPTPALGGSPRDRALAFIRDHEPVPRGWYAAPVGWIDAAMDGAFIVAIRSAVAQDDRVWLYAGAGIMAESQPAREWDETALKFRPMLTALGGTGDHGRA